MSDPTLPLHKDTLDAITKLIAHLRERLAHVQGQRDELQSQSNAQLSELRALRIFVRLVMQYERDTWVDPDLREAIKSIRQLSFFSSDA